MNKIYDYYEDANVTGFYHKDVYGNYYKKNKEVDGWLSTNNPDTILETNPHYTDKRFDKEQTIYGKKELDLHYDYSDRLWQWDYEKSEKASEEATKSGLKYGTARWFSKYLSIYYNKPIIVSHIIAGVNRSNGYSYLIFGYKEIDNSSENIYVEVK